MTKPIRSIKQQVKAATGKTAEMHENKKLAIWGSDSRSNFVDIISVGPISGVEEVFVNDVNNKTGEFPNSVFHTHTGKGMQKPWEGTFPYAERTESLGKAAEISEDDKYTKTEFSREVSGVGVSGIRVNFTTGRFTQSDNKNRRKFARAFFMLSLLDESGSVVKAVTTNTREYFATNPTSVQLTLEVDKQVAKTAWKYKVEMYVWGHAYDVAVQGNWQASTVTELYKDTQTYEGIAYCSGTIVASDVAAKTPKRQYLAEGYKVLVPDYTIVAGKNVFTGTYKRETSDSHAWNAMAVLTDDVWGAGLPLDKINQQSFADFHEYCKGQVDGEDRYSHSQYLIKQDNYFKLASQIVGTADGKLYEDSSGRIGVLVDKQATKRRVVTSYDLLNEKVKRITVPEGKKLNYIEGEFDDKTNNYKKTIIHVEDSAAITKNGVISKKIKLDSCTDPDEAKRILEKMLVTSQVASNTYSFEVGHSHEDLQIGEIISLYDRHYSRANYCGKVGKGSTNKVIQIDKRTPIDLSMMQNPRLVFEREDEQPRKAVIRSWTTTSITVSGTLSEVPEEFASFAVEDAATNGLRPTELRVLGLTNKGDTIQVDGVQYNDSLYDHVEKGSALEIPTERYLPPETQQAISALTVTPNSTGLVADWSELPSGWKYFYYWKQYGEDGQAPVTIKSGELDTNTSTHTLAFPLDPVKYEIIVRGFDGDGNSTASVAGSYTFGIDNSGTSTLNPPTELELESGTTYTGRSFTATWKQDTSSSVKLKGFILKAIQNGKTLTKKLGPNERSYLFSEAELESTFGEDFEREFTLRIVATDENRLTTTAEVQAINNPAPVAPTLNVANTGDIGLTLTGDLPSDVTDIVGYIWEGSDTSEDVPADATKLTSSTLDTISIPDEALKRDGTEFVISVAWFDSFGATGANFSKVVKTFDPNVEVPLPPTLTKIIPIDEFSVTIKYEHDGTYLKKLKAFYRELGETAWKEFSTIHPIPDTSDGSTYDLQKGEGSFNVSALPINKTYEFKAQVANSGSAFSVDSNILEGEAERDLTEIIEEAVEEVLEDFPTTDEVDQLIDDAVSSLDFAAGEDDRVLIVSHVNGLFDTNDRKTEIQKTEQQLISETEARVQDVTKLTAEIGDNKAGLVTVNQALVNETQARTTSYTQLDAKFENNKASITSVSEALATETTTRASEVTQLKANDQSQIDRLDAAESDIQGNATAVSSVTGKVNNPTTGLAATYSYTQQVESKADGTASSLTSLKNTVENPTSGLSATNTLALGTKTKADGNTTSINHLSNTISHPSTGLSATNSLAQVAKSSADGNAQSITNLSSTVSGVDGRANSALTLSNELDSQLQSYRSKAQLTVEANGNLGFIQLNATPTVTSFKVLADQASFVDKSGVAKVYFDTVNSRYVFNGHLEADSGTFKGTVTAATITGSTVTGGTIDIGSGAFSVDTLGHSQFAFKYGGYVSMRTSISNNGGMTLHLNDNTRVAAFYISEGAKEGVLSLGTASNKGRIISKGHGSTAITGYSSTTAIKGWGQTGGGSSWTGTGVEGEGLIGVYGLTRAASASGIAVKGFAPAGAKVFYGSGGGTVGPFTGSHDGFGHSNCKVEIGDIVCDKELFNISDISNAIFKMKPSSKPMDRTARGVLSGIDDLDDFTPAAVEKMEGWKEKLSGHKVWTFNALGEGAMNVCGEGGDLEAGDYICTSSMRGKGMKQPDQEYERPYTVAQVRHDVTFESKTEVKQVAVIYLRG